MPQAKDNVSCPSLIVITGMMVGNERQSAGRVIGPRDGEKRSSSELVSCGTAKLRVGGRYVGRDTVKFARPYRRCQVQISGQEIGVHPLVGSRGRRNTAIYLLDHEPSARSSVRLRKNGQGNRFQGGAFRLGQTPLRVAQTCEALLQVQRNGIVDFCPHARAGEMFA